MPPASPTGASISPSTLSRHALPWALGVGAVLIAPLWGFDYIPATDLPGHLAISSVLARLLTHDAMTHTYFALNLQPIPYYLVYALLTPCVHFAGPYWGAKIAMTVLGVLHVLAVKRLIRTARLPPLAMWAALFLFYGPLFFWGFVATVAGVPFVLLMIAELLAWHRLGGARYLVAAGLYGTIACLAHVVLLLPCAWAVFCCALLDPKRRWLVLVTLAVTGLGGVGLLLHGDSEPWKFETWHTAADHLQKYLGPFDTLTGRGAHALFVLLLAVWSRGGSDTDTRRFGRCFGVGLLVLFACCPTDIFWRNFAAWGLNFRFLTLAELGFLIHLAGARPWPHPRAFTAALLATVTLFCGSMLHTWQRFNTAAQPLREVLATIPPYSTVLARNTPHPFDAAWPPLLHHLTYYYLAQKPGYMDGLFAGKHIPIAETAAAPRADDSTAFAYVLIQDESLPNEPHAPAPTDATLVHQAGFWRVYKVNTR